ncbi:MAG: aldo/keto reductase [Bacteroidota bacterium]
MLQPTTLVRDSKLSFSRIILGVMKWGIWGKNYSPQEMLTIIESAIEMGLTTFDHADIYGHYSTEASFGEALRKKPSLRYDIQLISKCGIKMLSDNRPDHNIKSYDLSKAYIINCVNQSLKNLHTDYLDLLLIHRPSPIMDPDEIAEAFEYLLKVGKVRAFGVSNFSPTQFDLINNRFPIVTNQVQASVMHTDPFVDGTFDHAIRYRYKPMVWSPLGGGDFYTKLEDERVARIRGVMSEIAYKHGGITVDHLVLAFLFKHPAHILPVLGTGRLDRMRTAVEALDVELSDEEWFMIWEASQGHEVP